MSQHQDLPAPGAAGDSEPATEIVVTDENRGDYQVGYRVPPQQGQWRPGQSGNPHGRPKGARRRLPGARAKGAARDLERALKRRVETGYPNEPWRDVSLTEMVINELTQQVSSRGNVAAARELLHWIAEAERAKQARKAAAGARAEAEAKARAEAEARAAEEREQRDWEVITAIAWAEEDLADGADGAADAEAAGEPDRMEGLHLDEDEYADYTYREVMLMRLGCARRSEDNEFLIEPWVIEAAMTRNPDLALTRRETALLELLTARGPGEATDTAAILARVEAAPRVRGDAAAGEE